MLMQVSVIKKVSCGAEGIFIIYILTFICKFNLINLEAQLDVKNT